jgi:hypothetical protein
VAVSADEKSGQTDRLQRQKREHRGTMKTSIDALIARSKRLSTEMSGIEATEKTAA